MLFLSGLWRPGYTDWPGDRVDNNLGFRLVIRVGLISAVGGRLLIEYCTLNRNSLTWLVVKEALMGLWDLPSLGWSLSLSLNQWTLVGLTKVQSRARNLGGNNTTFPFSKILSKRDRVTKSIKKDNLYPALTLFPVYTGSKCQRLVIIINNPFTV